MSFLIPLLSPTILVFDETIYDENKDFFMSHMVAATEIDEPSANFARLYFFQIVAMISE